jgi:hypothetical protein
MTTFTQLTSASFRPPEPFTDQLRLAVAAYLARFKGPSREHTESDLRCYLAWCAERGLDPLAARQPGCQGSQADTTPDRVICVPLRTSPTADRRPDLPK